MVTSQTQSWGLPWRWQRDQLWILALTATTKTNVQTRTLRKTNKGDLNWLQQNVSNLSKLETNQLRAPQGTKFTLCCNGLDIFNSNVIVTALAADGFTEFRNPFTILRIFVLQPIDKIGEINSSWKSSAPEILKRPLKISKARFFVLTKIFKTINLLLFSWISQAVKVRTKLMAYTFRASVKNVIQIFSI